MAAHRHSTHTGWWDSPIHPAIGLTMFLAGVIAVWLVALMASAEIFGR